MPGRRTALIDWVLFLIEVVYSEHKNSGDIFQDGRCKTLDASADGYARGEACVTHLLEHFEGEEIKAANLADSCIIMHGTAVNQDGRSSSLTVRPSFPRVDPM